jgi:hypothetical protein
MENKQFEKNFCALIFDLKCYIAKINDHENHRTIILRELDEKLL